MYYFPTCFVVVFQLNRATQFAQNKFLTKKKKEKTFIQLRLTARLSHWLIRRDDVLDFNSALNDFLRNWIWNTNLDYGRRKGRLLKRKKGRGRFHLMIPREAASYCNGSNMVGMVVRSRWSNENACFLRNWSKRAQINLNQKEGK